MGYWRIQIKKKEIKRTRKAEWREVFKKTAVKKEIVKKLLKNLKIEKRAI